MAHIDEEVLAALKSAVLAHNTDAAAAVPAGMLAPLMKVARPGLKLHLDLEASRTIGAPLVAVSDAGAQVTLFDPLTKRQRQVAELIMSGLPNREIASQLGISLATVKDHVHAILDRLQLPSRAALIAAAHRLDQG